MTVKEYNKNYYQLHKKERKIQAKIYRDANKDKFPARQKVYRETHKGKAKIYAAAYYKTHKKEINRRSRTYYIANAVKITAWTKEWAKRRYKTDFKFRLNEIISSAVRISLKGNKAGRHWGDLVGYTLEELKKHLEKNFVDGMTWENYGGDGWVIDHKIPKSVFNFTKPEHRDFKRCWALKNLQPMWAKENLEKRAKLTKHFQPSLLI